MGETATRKIRRATALSEMSILEEEGQRGCHLVDFGILRLELEPSDHPWQHLRLVLPSPDALAALQEAGWRVVGSWTVFTYLKRPTSKTHPG